MTKYYKWILLISSIFILLALVFGIIMPPLISTGMLPASLIVILAGGMLAIIACILLFSINYLRQK